MNLLLKNILFIAQLFLETNKSSFELDATHRFSNLNSSFLRRYHDLRLDITSLINIVQYLLNTHLKFEREIEPG